MHIDQKNMKLAANIKNKKYSVYDEYNRPIESNVNLKRARSTVKANPGSKLIKGESLPSGSLIPLVTRETVLFI